MAIVQTCGRTCCVCVNAVLPPQHWYTLLRHGPWVVGWSVKKPKSPLIWQVEKTHPSSRNPNGVVHIACYRDGRRIRAYRMEPHDALRLGGDIQAAAQSTIARITLRPITDAA